jgi:hypothetical protein
LIGILQNKQQQETQNRDTLTRYNQDSIRKYDDLKMQRAAAEKLMASHLLALKMLLTRQTLNDWPVAFLRKSFLVTSWTRQLAARPSTL